MRSDRAQAVCFPLEVHTPDNVNQDMVHIQGMERIITSVENTWDHFFQNGPVVTADFFNEADHVLHAVR